VRPDLAAMPILGQKFVSNVLTQPLAFAEATFKNVFYTRLQTYIIFCLLCARACTMEQCAAAAAVQAAGEVSNRADVLISCSTLPDNLDTCLAGGRCNLCRRRIHAAGVCAVRQRSARMHDREPPELHFICCWNYIFSTHEVISR
jgi:hypothetical protein